VVQAVATVGRAHHKKIAYSLKSDGEARKLRRLTSALETVNDSYFPVFNSEHNNVTQESCDTGHHQAGVLGGTAL